MPDCDLPPELTGLLPIDPDDVIEPDLDVTLDAEEELAQMRALTALALLGISPLPPGPPASATTPMIDVTPVRYPNRDRAAAALGNMRRTVAVRHPRITGSA